MKTNIGDLWRLRCCFVVLTPAIVMVASLTSGAPAQQAYIKASNTGAGDKFGFSVAISGDTMAVGSPLEDSDTTGVEGRQFNNNAPDSGAAYVFVRRGDRWVQQAYLKAFNARAGDHFGRSVSVSGDTVVVGAPGQATGGEWSGAAYVFVRNGTIWSQESDLKASNLERGDAFGISVAVSGDLLVVGAWDEDSSATGVNGNQHDNSASRSGAAYVFVRRGAVWTQEAYLKASSTKAAPYPAHEEWFGRAVAISGNTVVVGAHAEDSAAAGVNGDPTDNSLRSAGAAYVFERHGTTWSQQAYLKASNPGERDYFGIAVAVDGDTVVVGAERESSSSAGINGKQNDEGAPRSGAAYVFVRQGTNWTQEAYLKASNTGAEDFFGDSVAVSDEIIAVGAYRESSKAKGVNGDQKDNGARESGAAYLFARRGGVWTQEAYLKASNSEAGDQLGYEALALSGDTLVMGAQGEDSKAKGVNGNEHNNGARESGAAYVFAGLGRRVPR